MVIVVDLNNDEDGAEPAKADRESWEADEWPNMNLAIRSMPRISSASQVSLNRNVVTEAFACYPVIAAMASHIDLNDLDALSRTCRQTRANLIQFRSKLLTATLHCENETDHSREAKIPVPPGPFNWYHGHIGTQNNLGPKSKVTCARDMVQGCKRCGIVVCRNCTIKPPSHALLPNRHRRLCDACCKACITKASNAPTLSLYSSSSPTSSPPRKISRSSSLDSTEVPFSATLPPALCTCPENVWLCRPCGRALRSNDAEYESIWTWRAWYYESSTIGVGIGDANRGVECGRRNSCVAAREIEHEIDCDAEDARISGSPPPVASTAWLAAPPETGVGAVHVNGTGGGNGNGNGNGSQPSTPGYERHEIEGIGGVLKKKLVRMVPVGACVPDFEDEKGIGCVLRSERDGRRRSWCSWCSRIVPSQRDRELLRLKEKEEREGIVVE